MLNRFDKFEDYLSSPKAEVHRRMGKEFLQT